jgi:hypothetical protein
MIPNTPKVVYNSITLLFTLPCRPWISTTRGVGAGKEESAAGVPSVWVTRREYPLRVPLRFLESEWPSVRAWLVWAMDGGGSFSFFPDQSVGTSYTCYLVRPTTDEDVVPSPDPEYPKARELEVTVRRTTAAAIDTAYF